MEISHMLFKQELDRVLDEAEAMSQEMSQSSDLEVVELFHEVQRRIKQLSGFKLTLMFMHQSASVSDLEDTYQAFKQIKIQLRFDRRKFKRIQTMRARIRKVNEMEAHAASFVA